MLIQNGLDMADLTRDYLKYKTALGRFGTLDEITGIIVFLSSDLASFFHSSIVQVDGGHSKHYRPDIYLE